jgi:DNA-binding transcriptional regulator PaaX
VVWIHTQLRMLMYDRVADLPPVVRTSTCLYRDRHVGITAATIAHHAAAAGATSCWQQPCHNARQQRLLIHFQHCSGLGQLGPVAFNAVNKCQQQVLQRRQPRSISRQDHIASTRHSLIMAHACLTDPDSPTSILPNTWPEHRMTVI